MANKNILNQAKKLQDEMFKWWRKTRGRTYEAAGFRKAHEQALYDALSEGVIAGAGLDVLEAEPASPDNPLFHLPNCVITGHFGNYSEESHVEMWLRPWEEAARVLQNKWPQGLVNPQVKEKFVSKWGVKPK